jgi:signal peptidase I
MRKLWIENRGIILFLFLFGLFRTAIADWNPIPSGSMRPSLLEGDVVLVNRVAYDLKVPLTDISLAQMGEPRRGDIVVFYSPKDATRMIKRLVALPGDTVEMRNGVLIINGEAAQYSDGVQVQEPIDGQSVLPALRLREHLGARDNVVQWLPTVPSLRSMPAFRVPEGHYWMMGDNRDNSADSRYIGPVPRHLLVGRAHHLVLSVAFKEDWLPRWERFGMPLS